MAGGKIPLTFRILKAGALQREETLTQAVIKVGKLSSSHLRLDDDSVSRMHAVIEVTGPGDISIIDLGSTKGTFVNGQKVNKAKLQSGDTLKIGDTEIEVSVGEESASEPAGAAAPDEGVIVSTPYPEAVAAPVAAMAPAPTVPAPAPVAPAMPARAPIAVAAAAPPAMANPGFGMDSVDDLGGARAIEIAAMLGNSVVGVKHVSDPKGGKISSVTYGLFAVSAAMLLLSGFAFFSSVGNAADNKIAQERWTEEYKEPLHLFRENRLSLGYDWMAFGGFAAGMVAFTMALIRVRNEKFTPFFRIGQDPDVDFATDNAPAASFPLVAPFGDDFVLNFTQGMEGEMMLAGTSTPLAELQAQGKARPSSTAPGATEVPIPHQARFRLKTGGNTFLVSSVPQPRRQTVPLFATIESRFLAYLAGSTIVCGCFLMLLFWIPPDPRLMSLDLGSGEDRMTRAQSKAEEEAPEEEEETLEKEDDVESGGTGTKMALDEGKMGKEDSAREAGQFAMENKDVDPQLARQQAADAARMEGIAGALQGDVFASLTATGDFSSGLDDLNVYGGLMGDEVGEMKGGFGFGVSGFGQGGGGTGWGTIGMGGYGTIGHGSGTGSGYGSGAGKGGMRGRRSITPHVKIGNATATGDLDKNIIRRYIRRKLPRIKYCYEKQLLVTEGLKGDVITNFQIAPTGAVLNSAAQGVSKEVADCVAEVIKTIQFPKPRGGGLVQVRYPFKFRASGE